MAQQGKKEQQIDNGLTVGLIGTSNTARILLSAHHFSGVMQMISSIFFFLGDLL